MNKCIYSAYILLILNLTGCASITHDQAPVLPSSILREASKFDGMKVTVSGLIESGSERYRIWDDKDAQQSGLLEKNCVGLAIPRDMESDEFDGKSVKVRGVFKRSIPERIIVLGGCNNSSVIYVEKISY